MNTITDKIKDLVCSDFKGIVNGDLNTDEMLQLFKSSPQAQEFALKHNYPTIDQLESIKQECRAYDIIVSSEAEAQDVKHMFVFGNSKVKLSFTGYFVGQVTIRHNSTVEINKSDNSIITVHLYDNAKVISNTNNKLIKLQK